MNSIILGIACTPILAFVITCIVAFKKEDGELHIDDSREEKDVYRFVLYGDPADFKKKKTVRFTVVYMPKAPIIDCDVSGFSQIESKDIAQRRPK